MSLQPYVRNITHTRGFASAAAAAKKRSDPADNVVFKPREEVKSSKVEGITVTSVETNRPLAKLAVYFRAGSRFERDNTQGLVHAVRICAGLGTSGASHFGITRNVESAGGNLSCTSGREFMAYTLEAGRDKISSVDKYLQDVAINQVFKPWEVKDAVARLRLERSIRPPEVRILDLIHKSAYRKGLGYSLYSPKWMLGNHSSDMLQNFTRGHFQEGAVVGVGMSHEQVVDFASRLNLKGNVKSVAVPATFYPGSDIRKEANDPLAYVALAIEGSGLADPKKAAAAALVHRALGSGARSKRGLNVGSKLLAAVGENETEATAVGFSASYLDSGLVGAYIAARPNSVNSITRKAADILRGAKFSAEDAVRAKGVLKGDIALSLETDAGLLEDLGVQSLLTGKASTLAELLSTVDSVSADDMNEIVRKGKLCMAAFGNVSNVPYLDELK